MPQQYRYLTPKLVESLDRLELVSKAIVEGFLQGLHRSPFHGFSVEFAEYRQYAPGDPLKHIDWQVYGRTDRYMIRQFEEETNVRAHVILDASGSMDYRASDKVLTKFHYACYLASALIYLLNRQHDAVGLVTCQDKIVGRFPPRLSPVALREMFLHLESLKPAAETGIVEVMHQVAESLDHRSLVIVISDFLEDVDRLRGAFMHFRHKRNEVLVLHVLDAVEVEFPFQGLIDFTELESGKHLEVEAAELRPGYRQSVEAYFRAMAKTCADGRIEYERMTTATPYDVALAAYLTRRKKHG